MEPLISVVIPTYNRIVLVETAVRSALDQTVSNVEVIVVDDGSTDGTEDRLAGLSSSRVRIARRDSNSGSAGAARNTGIALARAPWIAFLDSDDAWHPSHLWDMLKALEDHGGAFVGATSWPSSVDIERHAAVAAPHRHVTTRDLMASNPFITSGVVLSSSILHEAGRFPEKRGTYEDLALWLRISMMAPTMLVDSGTVRYRPQHDSLSRVTDAVEARMTTHLDFLDWLSRS